MSKPRILSTSISSLIIIGVVAAVTPAHTATVTWDGGGVGGTDLGTAVNWSGDVLPDVAVPDTALWDGTVAGPLSLIYSNAAFAGVAGNPGLDLSLAATQTDSLSLDSGVNTSSFRMNNLSIASGAGAFTLGDGSDTFNLTLGGAPGTHTWTNDSSNAATVASDVVFGLGGAGAHTLALTGTGNWTLNNLIGNGGGTLSLSKSGSGTLTLGGATVSTFTGGVTLSAGTLNVNKASALGNTATGALIITGGTLDNTSGAAITTTTAKPMNWNGDFTFTGTNNLSTNLGAVTIGGTAGQRTVNIAGGTLTTGLINAAAGFGLTKTGAGNLFMANTANTSVIQGMLDVQAGAFQMAGDVTVNGGLQGAGTVENGGAASKWFFVNNPTDTTFSGTIRDNPNNAAVRLGLVKRGTGTLNLTGANNITTDRFSIENGTIRITGTYTAGFGTGGNQNALIGSVANQNGQLIIDGGTFNANKTNNPSLAVSSGANTRGFLRMTSGTINTVAQMNIGNGSGAVGTRAFGAFTMSGGTVNSGSWLVVGANFDRAVLNQSGGTINVNANRMTIGAGGNESSGIVNMSGGNFNVVAGGNTGIYLGENGQGIMTLSGTGAVTLNTNLGANSGTMQFAGNATSLNGHFNLNGGTLTAFGVTKGNSTGGGIYRFNFNGGTLRANASNAAFFNDLANTTAYVNPGGAVIDSNGFNVTVSEPLLAPTGEGVSSIAVATGGAGYLDTPHVTLSGGTGTGATAIANVSGGAVTGFTITNPGVDYSPGDVLTVTLFGGGATTAATPGAVTFAANTSGGLTKSGAGTLTLNAANTYTGATTVSAGTLRLTDPASLASSGVTVNGAGAKLVQNSFTSLSAPVTLTNGTVDGTTTISSVTVGDGTGGVITNGDGTPSALTIDTLTFNGAATLNLTTASQSPQVLTTTTLTTGAVNAAGIVTINATNSSGIWSTGVYSLISYGTLAGSGFGNFIKGTVPGLGARQSAALSNPAGFVALTITGDLPVWTGAVNGNWTTDTIAEPKNWVLQTAATTTDYITGDTAVFDDSATGTTTVSISSANVSPTSTTFNNSLIDYTVSSGGGFGIASGFLVKTGTASVTLATPNTYAGGTTLNGGTLNLNHSSALGTGPLTIAGSTIDNTSGGAITLSTNNTQNWNADFTFGGTNNLNLGTGAVPLTASRTVTTNGTATLTVGGVISGTGFGLTKTGPGTLALGGANTYTGATNVTGGTLVVTGGINSPNAANIGQITINGPTDAPVMHIQGGTINATKTAAPSIVAGSTGGNTGTIIMDGGTLNAVELWLGDGGGSYGGMTLNSGSVAVAGWLPVSRTGTAVLNVNGGAISVSAQNIVLSSFGGANGDLNATAGTITTTSVAANQGALIVGEAGNGVLNVSGTAAINISGALGVNIARVAGGNGIVNLNGGTVTTPSVTKGAAGSSAIFNFDGGTLRPTAANAAFMTGLTSANVFSGGANIDTNGQNITIAQPLLAAAGSGVTSIAVDDGGAGYVHTPVVRIFGGLGTGATAVANVSGGVVTGITITNPGSGYDPGDSLFASIDGGGATSIATLGIISLAANSTAGGLTKLGAGTLTLSGANTYSGPTTVSAGTLALDATGSINGSSGITINGTGAKLVQSNTTTSISPGVIVTNGTLDGTGTVDAVLVGAGTGGIVANGNGGTGVLTLGSITFSGVAAANVSTAGSAGIAVTGNLSTSGVGTVTLNVPIGVPWVTGSTYDLISFGTFGGAISHFVAGTVAGLGARQIPTPVLNGSNIALSIGGDTPVWTGVASSTWSTTAVGTPFNWKLQTAGTNTEFLTNDQVLFNDTATGTTTITINDATVTPANVTFDNSAQNYTVNGTFGIASGLLVKSGTGSVTLNTANSYTLGTTLNAGTLNINTGTAIGTGALTINGGTIGNTSGGAITLTNNNAQNWNGDFTFAGPNNLNMGTGVATLGGSGSSRQITVTAGLVSIGSINGTGGSGYGLTKAGAGTLTVGSAISTVNGDLAVDAGTLQIGASDFFATGLTGGGTIENGSATTRWVYINNTADKSFSGTLQNGAGPGLLGFLKRGTATQTLTGNNTLGSDLTVENGTVRITGTTGVGSGTSGLVNVGNVANQNGVLEIDGGTLNALKTNSPSIAIGSVANSRGFLKMTSGAITTSSEFHIGRGTAGSYSAFTMSGGSVTSGNWFVVGLNNDRAVFNQSGGTVAVNANRLTIGAGGAGSVGVASISAGSFTSNVGAFIGENGTGTLNISGSAAVTFGDTRFNHAATSTSGTLNLLGGTLNTAGFSINLGTGAGRLNLNGGTLKATANNAAFLNDLAGVEARVYSGGVTIDSGAFAIAIAEPLLAPTGSGVASVDIFDGGGGYIDTPIVTLSGGIGSGATAIASITGGVVTGITITNPGSGYDPGDFLFATVEGGGAGFPASLGTVNLAANDTSGGLTKTGSGTLTLNGVNTYGGTTTVSEGTLAFGVSEALSELVIASGATARILETPPVPAEDGGGALGLLDGESAAAAPGSAEFADGGAAQVAAVPEPGAIGLLMAGALGLLARRRRSHPAG